MPPLPDAERAIKMRWTGLMGGVRWANVNYLQFTTGVPTAADLTTLATSIATALNTNIRPLLHTGCTIDLVELIDVSTRTGNMGSYNAGVTGNRAGTPVPNQVACCVTKTIARRYRGGHPRMYLPGAVIADCNGSVTWTGTYSGLVKTNTEALFTAINALTSGSTGNLKWVNVSYWYTPVPKQPPVLRTSPIVEPVTGFRVDSRMDTQRRRLE